MRVPIFQLDAFTGTRFRGNPAAVCILEEWLPDDRLQAIASENNLSETAFVVGGPEHHELRWFTPVAEVDLCGHATLASAKVVIERSDPPVSSVAFETRSGRLTVKTRGDRLWMDFPAAPAVPAETTPEVEQALGASPQELLAAERDYLAVFDSEAAVRALRPDFARLAALDRPGVIASAPGRSCDFVSRFFAPALGVPEDPVTGSAHCTLVPYWSDRLGRARLHARQISARGGELFCVDRGERVEIAGECVLYLEGEIQLDS